MHIKWIINVPTIIDAHCIMIEKIDEQFFLLNLKKNIFIKIYLL